MKILYASHTKMDHYNMLVKRGVVYSDYDGNRRNKRGS